MFGFANGGQGDVAPTNNLDTYSPAKRRSLGESIQRLKKASNPDLTQIDRQEKEMVRFVM